jgi:hypothetical protein
MPTMTPLNAFCTVIASVSEAIDITTRQTGTMDCFVALAPRNDTQLMTPHSRDAFASE